MENQVLKTIQKYNLIIPGDTVVAGLSGGADSVALILSLSALKEKLKIKKIIACHINHNLRETAKRDEDFARNLCKELNIDFYVKSVDIKKEKQRLKVCEEEAGRILRYEFFHEISKREGATKIATAHNLNDQIETFFIRLLRGSSLDGLISVKPFREDGVVRPLIEVKREDIENYLEQKNQAYVTDETNFETRYLRNKVRLLLIPYLKENFSFSEDVILNTIELFKKDSVYIEKEVKNVLNMGIIRNGGIEFPLSLLKEKDEAVLSRVIICIFKNLFKITLSKTKIDNTVRLIKNAKTGKEIKLSKEIYAITDYDKLLIKRKEESVKYAYNIEPGDNVIKEIGRIINLSKESESKDSIRILSCDNLKVRCRNEGDRVFIKNVGHKKVKDIFIDNKISREKRGTYPIILQNDDIIWIPGLYKKEDKDGEYCLSIKENGK